jgi:hypothetical protein
MNFDATNPVGKLKILGLEGTRKPIVVEAQFNPKELQIDKSVPWQKQKKAKNPADLEFTGGEPMTMSLELMFDGFEGRAPIGIHPTVQANIQMLVMLADVDETLKRPSKVKVIWGGGDLPHFEGVIESVSTKYTMFAPDGRVLRATANVKLKQAADLKLGKKT